MNVKRLVVAADHGGVELKDEIVARLREEGYEVLDLGTHGGDSVHYPDYAFRAAKMVSTGEIEAGILVCGTGIGMSIAANKLAGVYCARVTNGEEGRLAAEHNHANMLALGGRTTSIKDAWQAVRSWLETKPGGDRHELRVNKIKQCEMER